MRHSTSVVFGAYIIFLRQILAADSPPLLFARQASGTCISTSKVCGNGCIDNSWTCCPDRSGGCPSTKSCVLGDNGEYGCCPIGETCTGAGGAITSVAISSGTVGLSVSNPISSHPVGQPFTSGASIGVVGTDGTIRYCSTGSYLCPASVNYGCCPVGDGCGLTNCPVLGSMTASPTATTTLTRLSSVIVVTTVASATVGQVITQGASIGTVGTDGTTRFCTTGSYLCPASYNYGCCPNTDNCGLTDCPHRSTLVSGPGTTSVPATATQMTTDVTSIGVGVSFTDGGSVGVIGTDGTTRFCTTGSYLCPASLNYGCCPNTDGCGLTNCPATTPTGSLQTSVDNIGATITDGSAIGIVGTDGTTRFCTTGSSLCPASLNYGCCKDGYACGLTNCTPMSGSLIFSSTSDVDVISQTAFFNTIQTGSVLTDSAKSIIVETATSVATTSTPAPARSSATIVGSSVLCIVAALFVLIATLAFAL